MRKNEISWQHVEGKRVKYSFRSASIPKIVWETYNHYPHTKICRCIKPNVTENNYIKSILLENSREYKIPSKFICITKELKLVKYIRNNVKICKLIYDEYLENRKGQGMKL